MSRKPRTMQKCFGALMLALLAGCASGPEKDEPDKVAQSAPAEPELVQITVGEAHACALLEAGRVYCWGKNDHGQLGDGTKIHSQTPVAVVGLDDATHIAAGAHHTCAVRDGGRIGCWGRNDRQQVGIANRSRAAWAITEPTKPAGIGNFEPGGLNVYRHHCRGELRGIEEVRAAGHQSCAVHESGAVLCWGDNEETALGVRNEAKKLSTVDCPTVMAGSPPPHIFEQAEDADTSAAELLAQRDLLVGDLDELRFEPPEDGPETDTEAGEDTNREACEERVVFGDPSSPNSITFRQNGRQRVLYFEQLGARIYRGGLSLTFPTLEIRQRGGAHGHKQVTTVLRDMGLRAKLPGNVGANPEAKHRIDADFRTIGWNPRWPYLGPCMGAHFQGRGQMTITHFEEPEPGVGGTGRIEATLQFGTGDPELGAVDAELVVTDFGTETQASPPRDADSKIDHVTATYNPMGQRLEIKGRRGRSTQSIGDIDGEGIYAWSSFGDTTVFVLDELAPYEVRGAFWKLEGVEAAELPHTEEPLERARERQEDPSFFGADKRRRSKRVRLATFDPAAHDAELERRFFATKIHFGVDLADENLVPGGRGAEAPDPWMEQAREFRARAEQAAPAQTVLLQATEDSSAEDAFSLRHKRQVIALGDLTRGEEPILSAQHLDDWHDDERPVVLLDANTLLPTRREHTSETWYKEPGSVPTEITIDYEPGKAHVSVKNEVQGHHEKSFEVPTPTLDRRQLLATIPYLPLEPGYRTGFGIFDARLEQAPRYITFSMSYRDGEAESTEPRREEAKPYRLRADIEDGRLIVVGERTVSSHGAAVEALEVLLLDGSREVTLLVEKEAPHHILQFERYDKVYRRETLLHE